MTVFVQRTRHVVRDHRDLLRLTNAESMDELSMEASVWANNMGPYGEMYLDDDEASVRMYAGWQYAWLDFPFTINHFWNWVAETHRVLERHERIRDLPDCHEGYTEVEVTQELADFFGVPAPKLVSLIGGGWYPLDPAELGEWLDGVQEIARWYGSGDPVQVLLGFATTAAVVAVPDPTHPGRAKDDGSWHARIELGATGQLHALSEAVSGAWHDRHADLWSCRGCRRHLAPELRKRTCPECRATYTSS